MHACGKSRLLLAEGDAAGALPIAERAFATREEMGITHEGVKEAYVIALEAALALGDLAKAEELLTVVEALPPGRYPQFLRAQSARFRACLATRAGGSERIDDLFKGAAGLFRELDLPFWRAVTLLEHAELLVEEARPDGAEPLLDEARQIFERLEAKPWLERLEQVGGRATVPA